MTVREWWRIIYRQFRIIRREHAKMRNDLFLFGSGAVEIGEHVPDGIRDVPLERLERDAVGRWRVRDAHD